MGGGSSDTKTVNQTTKVELPAWVDAASQGNYQQAAALGKTAYDPAANIKTIAGQNGLINEGNSSLVNGRDNTASMFSAANAANNGLMNYSGPAAVTAGSIAGTDLSKYLNPYLSSVVDASMADLDNSRQKAITSNGANASAASAFGGTRQAVTDGVTNADSSRQAGLLSSQLRSGAYDAATALATGDLNRKLAADTTTASNDLAAAGVRTGAVANQNSIANNTGDMYNKFGTSLLYSGQQQQGLEQRQLDANRSNAGAQYQDSINKLNLQLAALGMSPYGKTESTNGTTTSETSPDIGSMLLGGAKMGMGMFGK